VLYRCTGCIKRINQDMDRTMALELVRCCHNLLLWEAGNWRGVAKTLSSMQSRRGDARQPDSAGLGLPGAGAAGGATAPQSTMPSGFSSPGGAAHCANCGGAAGPAHSAEAPMCLLTWPLPDCIILAFATIMGAVDCSPSAAAAAAAALPSVFATGPKGRTGARPSDWLAGPGSGAPFGSVPVERRLQDASDRL
jgi:hypothetical protein